MANCPEPGNNYLLEVAEANLHTLILCLLQAVLIIVQCTDPSIGVGFMITMFMCVMASVCIVTITA